MLEKRMAVSRADQTVCKMAGTLVGWRADLKVSLKECTTVLTMAVDLG